MTIADLSFGIVYMATKFVMVCFPLWFCRTYYILVWACQILSMLSLLLLNIDKFISLRYPLHYQQIVTKMLVGGLTGLVWFISLFFSVITFSTPISSFNSIYVQRPETTNNLTVMIPIKLASECYLRLDPRYLLTSWIGFYIVPIVLSFGISMYIYWVAQHLADTLPGLPHSHVERKRAKQRVVKRVLFVFSSTVWTAVTSLPYRMVYVGTLLCSLACGEDIMCKKGCRNDIIILIGYIFWFLLPLGCVGNPLITIITQRIYRLNLMKIAHRLFVDRLGMKFCKCFKPERSHTGRINTDSSKELNVPHNNVLRLLGASVRYKHHSTRSANRKNDVTLTNDVTTDV